MKKQLLIFGPLFALLLLAFTPMAGKWVSKSAHISFYSHTAVEDITANNYKALSTLDPSSGEVVFTVPMQGFEFEKSLMQKHFNSNKFLDTKKHPKAKFVGKITNLGAIDFSKNGTYNAEVTGELTIKGTTRPLNEKGTITVQDNTINVKTKLPVVLADYGITFSKGKPSTNIAKEVEITLNADYQPE